MDQIVTFDKQLFLLINGGLHAPLLDVFFATLTNFSIWVWPLTLIGVLLFWRGDAQTKLGVFWCVLAIVFADRLGQDLKEIVERQRPFFVFGTGMRGVGTDFSSRSYSFPSNHAVNVFAGAMIIGAWWGLAWWKRALLFTIAGLVAYSRVYVGVHYPSDVLAGALLGVGVSTGLLLLVRQVRPLWIDGEGRLNWEWPGLALLLMTLLGLLQFSVIAREVYDLSPEEAQYWDWSRRLDLSYYSKPPLIAWLIAGSTGLFGNNAVGVRLAALLPSIVLAWVAWKLAVRASGSPRMGFLTLLCLGTMPLYVIGSLIITTDTPLLLFWGICCLALHHALVQGSARAWIVAGVAFGLGLLSKYAMVYMLACVGAYMVLRPEARTWLRRREFFAFLALGMLAFVPVLWWNWKHGWVSFLHVAGQATAAWDPLSLPRYVAEQALLAGGPYFLMMAWGAWDAWKRRREAGAESRVFLLCMSAPVYLLLLVKSAFGEVLGNWAAAAYVTGAMLAAWRLSDLWEQAPALRPRVASMTAAAVLLLVLVMVPLHEREVYRDLRKLAIKLGAKPNRAMDPANSMVGWDDLGEHLSREVAKSPRPEKTFVLTRRYQEAAELAFYMHGQPRTYVVNMGRRMNQYNVWGGFEELKGWDAIYVFAYSDAPKGPNEFLIQSFDKVGPLQFFDVGAFGIPYRRYVYYRLENFSGTFHPEVTRIGRH